MASKTKTFGAILREKRLDRGFGLREFATMVGVSSTYISQLEQENIDPPTAERASKMAELLGENPDAWIALAGRVPDDLERIIQSQPILFTALIREADGLLPEQLSKLIESARKMKRSKF